MAGRITSDKIEQINLEFLKCHTYAETARRVGVSATTVKKYIIKDFVPKEELKLQKFNGEIPPMNIEMFKIQNWGDLCVLSHKEKDEIRELWKEMSL